MILFSLETRSITPDAYHKSGHQKKYELNTKVLIRRQVVENAGIANQVGRQKLQEADPFLTSISHTYSWLSLLLTAVEKWLCKSHAS